MHKTIVLALVLLATALPVHAQEASGTPVHLSIPSIGADADIVPINQDEDGVMQSPPDPDMVGWYELGPKVGTFGNAIFDGHTDWAGKIRVFGRLSKLEANDEIIVTDDSGVVRTYLVDWVTLYDREGLPLDVVFAQQLADQQITLITCGGVFSRSRGYLGRWVVRARLDNMAYEEP